MGNDIITVRYGTYHPCVDYIFGLTVVADFKRKAPEVETKEHFGKLSISFKDLLDIQKTDGINKFYFNYYGRTNNGTKDTGKVLFALTFSED